MKEKKGFTLVEILGVIVILGLLTILMMPNILNSLNKHQKDVSDLQDKSLYDSAEEYFKASDITYGKISNKMFCVSLKTLQENNYAESDLLNALTGKKYNSDKTFIILKAGNNPSNIDYSINENGSCSNKVETCTISIGNNNSVTYIGKTGESYTDKEKFLEECPFSNGINITSTPTGWAKQKEVQIAYNGNDLSNLNYVADPQNFVKETLNSNLTIYKGIITKNQTIVASASRTNQTNQVINTYKEDHIDTTPPTCQFIVTGEQDSTSKWYRTYPTLTLRGEDKRSKLSRMYLIHNKKLIDKKGIKKETYDENYQIKENTSDSGKYSGYVLDNANNSQKCEISGIKIDTTKPTINFTSSKTTKSISVTASASALSGIRSYRFSKDGGSTWTNYQTSNTYTFNNLRKNTNFDIVVEVQSNSGLTNRSNKTIKTDNFSAPSYYGDGNIITIYYESGCGSYYTCSYNKGSWQNTNNSRQNIDTSWNNGSIIASISDGYNSESSSYTYSYAVRDYGYNGSSYSFTAPYSGTYKLEVWGAQGGSIINLGIQDPTHKHEWGAQQSGANGGYASGNAYISAGSTIYIVIGGAGGNKTSYTSEKIAKEHNNMAAFVYDPTYGGYNGGGKGGPGGKFIRKNSTVRFIGGCGGGGATHMAYSNGLLKNVSQSQVLVVAGGGGGASGLAIGTPSAGGNGGGYLYGQGQDGQSGAIDTYDGQPTTGAIEGHGGGGGGWSGGTSPQDNTHAGTSLPGNGGTNYISGSLSNHNSQSGIQGGNGYGRITYLQK